MDSPREFSGYRSVTRSDQRIDGSEDGARRRDPAGPHLNRPGTVARPARANDVPPQSSGPAHRSTAPGKDTPTMPTSPCPSPPRASTTLASSTTPAASSFVVDMHGPPQPPHGRARASASLCNLDHRGATSAEAERRRRRRDPDPGARPVPPRGRRLRRCPTAGAYAVGIAFLPRGRRGRGGRQDGVEKIAGERGPPGPRLARRARSTTR